MSNIWLSSNYCPITNVLVQVEIVIKRQRSLVVNDLGKETKGSRFESGC